ncbi:MAG: nonstructural protein [Microvirus sp.]|nr:MAG: nonstructural protein [Microvirus sp.]
MLLQIVCMRDIVADCYAQPQFVASIGAFIRGFSDEVNRKAADNQLYNHPGDFEVFHIGVYDDNTCDFEIFADRKQIAIGKNVAIPRE